MPFDSEALRKRYVSYYKQTSAADLQDSLPKGMTDSRQQQ